MWKRLLIVLALTAALAVCLVPRALGNTFTLIESAPDSGVSYTYPSIVRDWQGHFNITFLAVEDYHIGTGSWAADLYGGTMVQTAPGAFEISINDCTRLNVTPGNVLVGNEDRTQDGFPWSHWWRVGNWTRPSRRGDMIAWSEKDNAEIHTYDFGGVGGDPAAGGRMTLPPSGGIGRSINPRVNNGTVAYWAFRVPTVDQPAPDRWAMVICHPESNGAVLIDDAFLEGEPDYGDPFRWAPRSGDICPDLLSVPPGMPPPPEGVPSAPTGRAVITRFTVDPAAGQWGYVPYWCRYEAFGQPEMPGYGGWHSELMPIESPFTAARFISGLVMSDDFVVWQTSLAPPWEVDDPDALGPLVVARWNPDANAGEGDYEYLAQLPEFARAQDPSLFGSYLVWADNPGENIFMVDLDHPETWNDPTILVTAEPGTTVDAPAVWVDPATGEYVVLYQSSASPASLMGVSTYTGGAVPEPAALTLLGLGALALRRRRS